MLPWLVLALLLLLLMVLALFLRHPYLLQDAYHVHRKLQIQRLVRSYAGKSYFIMDRFSELAREQPHKTFVLFGDERFTYRQADELSNKAARALLQSGRVRQGDTVALFLPNDPSFLWLFLGLAKLGCPASFLNYNIRSRSLLHCFSRCGATALVVAEELQDAVEEILPDLLEQQVAVFILADKCKSAETESLKDKVRQASADPIPKECRSHLNMGSTAVYIYTSGTTGLPKAAEVSHGKVWAMSSLMSVTGVKPWDVLYTSLPLYHSAGFLCFTSTIEKGATVAIRNKFSASQFWDDCRKYDVTVIQYIGEIMRYLCNTPKKPNDHIHKVRVAIGNGIRPEIWREFVRRFGNLQISEFYGATEGNFALLNYSNHVGAVGRDNFLHRWYFSYALIKFDVDEDAPVRDSSGFCMKADTGEPGLLVCEITADTPFQGYARDLQQTEKKKLRDVFRKGDLYFNTGDLLSIDKDGFFYFQDRVGDTFRWKGENVATAEVADVLTMSDCIEEAIVYGVEVPGLEGRAGMAAVTPREGRRFDSAAFYQHVAKFLPNYARPRFVRVQGSLDVTGTFKYLKTALVKEGFDPSRVAHPLHFLDDRQQDYVPLTQEIFDSVVSGKIKI